MRNTFGNLFTLTTFGESHGPAIGGVVDGMPAGVDIDMDFILKVNRLPNWICSAQHQSAL